MRLTALALALSMTCLPGCTSSEKAADSTAKRPRVMVLGIDGATWDVAEPMIEAGELPNLAKLYRRGIHGILESRPPALSPVVWTTIFTGRSHEDHGVEDWKTSQSKNRKVAAIWEMTSARGLRTDVFNVPGSWPPEQIDGVMFSGFPISGSTVGGNTGNVYTSEEIANEKIGIVYRASIDEVRKQVAKLEVGQWSPWFEVDMVNRPTNHGVMDIMRLAEDKYYFSPYYRIDDGLDVTYPADAREALDAKLGFHFIPEGAGWSKYQEEDTPTYLAEHLVQIFDGQSAAANEYAGGDWDLFIYVMTLVDRVSHPYWAYANAEDYEGITPERAARFGDAVADAYRRSDKELGEVLAKAGGDPYVIICSDHGFQSFRGDKTKPVGAHDLDGVYLVSGPGLKDTKGERAYIETIAPTALYLLGMPVAKDMAGTVIPEVVAQLGREPEVVASYERGGRRSTDEPVDESTWEQLRGLGYVEGPPPKKDSPEGRDAEAKKQALDRKQALQKQAEARKEAMLKAQQKKRAQQQKQAQQKKQAQAKKQALQEKALQDKAPAQHNPPAENPADPAPAN